MMGLRVRIVLKVSRAFLYLFAKMKKFDKHELRQLKSNFMNLIPGGVGKNILSGRLPVDQKFLPF